MNEFLRWKRNRTLWVCYLWSKE